MRIAYLINQYPKVSHTFVRREIRALEELGLSIERISLRSVNEPLIDADDRAEQQRTFVVLSEGAIGLLWALVRAMVVHPLSFWRAARLALEFAGRSPGARWKHLAYLAEAAVLRHRYRRAGLQGVHAHFGTNSTTVAALWHALGGPPFSFTVHGPEEFDKPEAIALDLKIATARFVVAISEFGRSQLMRWCPFRNWNRLHVVHCGVEQTFLESPSRVPESRRLVCVGRLCEQKGHGLLIEAATRLMEEGTDFELVLVGDGPLRAEIEAALRDSGLDQTIRITGWLSGSDVQAEIRAARALVLPSFAEGLPVVIMEALALGRPVISTYIAGIPELVEPGVNGWLVPAGALEPLCGAIREALQAPAARLSEMGKSGALRVSVEHNVLAEAAKLRALFGAGCGEDRRTATELTIAGVK